MVHNPSLRPICHGGTSHGIRLTGHQIGVLFDNVFPSITSFLREKLVFTKHEQRKHAWNWKLHGGLSCCSFMRVTLQGTNISNLWKRNIIFKGVLGRDLV